MTDPEELGRILQRYELRIAALEKSAKVPPVQPTLSVNFTAREGQTITLEPPAAGIKGLIVQATKFNRGARITFVQLNKNPVTFESINGLVNGVARVVVNSPGTYSAISDGNKGWALDLVITATGVSTPLTADFVVGTADATVPNGRVATASVEITPSIAVAHAISWALNAGSVVLSRLQNLTGLSVLGRAANSAGVMAAITAGGAQQYLRSNTAGTSLEFADPASASIVNTGGQFVRAALTGDVTAAQALNATAFRSFASKTVLANASSIAAVPSDLAGTASFQHLRVNSTNNGLEWSVLTTGDFPANSVPLTALATQASDTFLGNISGVVQSPTPLLLANLAGAGLGFAAHALSVNVGPSMVIVADNVVRAALGGDVNATQDSNATAFRPFTAKSVLANATNVGAIPTDLTSSAAFQHLRVNSANNALEWSVLTTGDFPAASVPLTALATLPTLNQVLTAGNSTGGKNLIVTAADAFIFGTDPGGVAQVRSSATIDHAATSWTGTFAGAPGFSVAATQFNFTTTGAAKNVLFGGGGLQLTRSAAIAAVSTVAGGVIYAKTQSSASRILFASLDNLTSVEYPLDCTGITPQLTATSISAATTVLDTTGRFTIKASTAAAGNRWKCYFSVVFVRGATATVFNLNCFFGIGVPSISLALAAPTAAGTYFLRCEATVTVFTTGVAGTAGAEIFAWCTNVSGGTGPGLMAGNANLALAFNSTIDLVLVGQCQMNTLVAATSIQASGGNIERVC